MGFAGGGIIGFSYGCTGVRWLGWGLDGMWEAGWGISECGSKSGDGLVWEVVGMGWRMDKVAQ